MITTDSVAEFLAGQRIAVIGASDDRANFGATIYRALREHGYDVVAINPNAGTVAGDRCYADLGSVPAPIDGAIIMVNQALAADVVRACAERHVPRCLAVQGSRRTGSPLRRSRTALPRATASTSSPELARSCSSNPSAGSTTFTAAFAISTARSRQRPSGCPQHHRRTHDRPKETQDEGTRVPRPRAARRGRTYPIP